MACHGHPYQIDNNVVKIVFCNNYEFVQLLKNKLTLIIIKKKHYDVSSVKRLAVCLGMFSVCYLSRLLSTYLVGLDEVPSKWLLF